MLRQWRLVLPLLLSAPFIVAIAPYNPFNQGANCVFIGHSFFVPVATRFDEFATASSSFPNHVTRTVFRGGSGGSPRALWNDADTKGEIEGWLLSGQVDLLGLTLDQFSVQEDYERWIDLALDYNPDSAFFIGFPWATRGPDRETSAFDADIERGGQALFEQVVMPLRSLYPDTQILFVNYGKTASIMKGMFEADKLVDIDNMVGGELDSLFTDDVLGHGGEMLIDVSALEWLAFFYNAPVSAFQHQWNRPNVLEIYQQVVDFNVQFLVLPTAVPTPAPTGQPTPPPATSAPTASSVSFEGNLCFSSLSEVDVLGKGKIPLNKVQLYDSVLTDGQRYEPIYSFAHYNPHRKAPYLHFLPSGLEISSNHLIPVTGRGFILASEVKVGDRLVSIKQANEVVSGILNVSRHGAYAPFTLSGTIVVNDMVASTYALYKDDFKSLPGPIYQWAAHLFQTPHRLLCFWISMCPTQSHTDEGLSQWVNGLIRCYTWIRQWNMQVLGLLLAVPALLLLIAIEACVFQLPFVALPIIGLVLSLRCRFMKTKQL